MPGGRVGMAQVLPGEVVVGGLLLIAIAYFAVVDFIYVGRLASYAAILSHDPEPAVEKFSAPGEFNPMLAEN